MEPTKAHLINPDKRIEYCSESRSSKGAQLTYLDRIGETRNLFWRIRDLNESLREKDISKTTSHIGVMVRVSASNEP